VIFRYYAVSVHDVGNRNIGRTVARVGEIKCQAVAPLRVVSLQIGSRPIRSSRYFCACIRIRQCRGIMFFMTSVFASVCPSL